MAALLRTVARPIPSRPSNLLSSTPSIRPSILSLPPPLRTRAFHASRPQQFIEPVIHATHSALDAVHSVTGLPWGAAIPVFALLVRGVLMVAVDIPQRRRQQRQIDLIPTLRAANHGFRATALVHINEKNPDKAHYNQKELQEMTKGRLLKRQRELFRRHKCEIWKRWIAPAVNVPLFLMIVETLRRMCGAGQGLLGLIFGTKAGAPSQAPEGLWDQLPHEAATTPADTVTTASETSSLPEFLPEVQSLGLEPSFASEGILWFPSLLAPDPTFVLPFALGIIMIFNTYGSPSIAKVLAQLRYGSIAKRTVKHANRHIKEYEVARNQGTVTNAHVDRVRSAMDAAAQASRLAQENKLATPPPPEAATPTETRNLAMNALRTLMLSIPIICMQMPVAIVWYWLCSSGLRWAQLWALDKYMPIKPPIKACKLESVPGLSDPTSRLYSKSMRRAKKQPNPW